MSPQPTTPSGWAGWVYFAGFLLIVRGFLQGFFGIVALFQDDVYVITNRHFAIFNFTAWGWVHLVLALILITGAFSLFSGRMWGRIVGSIAAALSLLANLMFLPTYPVWSIIAIVIDILVLYAILVRGGELRDYNG